jgi:hypothetical protein
LRFCGGGSLTPEALLFGRKSLAAKILAAGAIKNGLLTYCFNFGLSVVLVQA